MARTNQSLCLNLVTSRSQSCWPNLWRANVKKQVSRAGFIRCGEHVIEFPLRTLPCHRIETKMLPNVLEKSQNTRKVQMSAFSSLLIFLLLYITGQYKTASFRDRPLFQRTNEFLFCFFVFLFFVFDKQTIKILSLWLYVSGRFDWRDFMQPRDFCLFVVVVVLLLNACQITVTSLEEEIYPENVVCHLSTSRVFFYQRAPEKFTQDVSCYSINSQFLHVPSVSHVCALLCLALVDWVSLYWTVLFHAFSPDYFHGSISHKTEGRVHAGT